MISDLLDFLVVCNHEEGGAEAGQEEQETQKQEGKRNDKFLI